MTGSRREKSLNLWYGESMWKAFGDSPALNRFGKVIWTYRFGAEESGEHANGRDFARDTAVALVVPLEVLHVGDDVRFRQRFHFRLTFSSETRKLLQVVAVSIDRVGAELSLYGKVIGKGIDMVLHSPDG